MTDLTTALPCGADDDDKTLTPERGFRLTLQPGQGAEIGPDVAVFFQHGRPGKLDLVVRAPRHLWIKRSEWYLSRYGADQPLDVTCEGR